MDHPSRWWSKQPWCVLGRSHEHVCHHIRNRSMLLFLHPLTIVILCYMVQLTRTLPDYSVFKILPLNWSCVCQNIPTSRLCWKDSIVRERVCFKIMLHVHRAVNCRGPVYLSDLICIYTPTISLRSAATKQLKRPKTNCKAGDASFPAAAPDLSSRLPFSVR